MGMYTTTAEVEECWKKLSANVKIATKEVLSSHTINV